jgi:diketogulonate reductase-like aldo/keto reductase
MQPLYGRSTGVFPYPVHFFPDFVVPFGWPRPVARLPAIPDYIYSMLSRTIPSSGESIPVIGMGTWQTFDKDNTFYSRLKEVLTRFHSTGGRLIDSSPMYGKAETVVGDLSCELPQRNEFFYATKVWIQGKEEGIQQMEASMHKMQRSVMDLIQVHNLVDHKIHLDTLRTWKDQGKVRYMGITHYKDESHGELERIILSEKIDFVQFNYSVLNRNAEKRLLDMAAASGVATLINRPFGEGKLFSLVAKHRLPQFAIDHGIQNWSAFFLRYIVSHPAVTCVIPATGDPAHVLENASGGMELPDDGLRKKMADHISSL